MAGATLPPPLKGVRIVEALSEEQPLHLQWAIGLAGKIASELGADVAVMRGAGGAIAPQPEAGGDGNALHAFLYSGKTLLDRDSAAAITAADAILTMPGVQLPDDRTVVVVSDFGANPHLQNVRASELTILATSGLLHVMGLQAGQPLRLPGHQPAYAAGLAAYLAMIAGLLAPTPRIADVSVLEAMVWVNWKLPAVSLLSPGAAPALGGEWQALPARDGHVALVYQERDWSALVDLLDVPALCDERFATRAMRIKHYDALINMVRPWFAARTKRDIYARAKQKGLPLGPVLVAEDIVCDAQYLERDFLRLLPRGGFLPRIPLMWNGVRPGVETPGLSLPREAVSHV